MGFSPIILCHLDRQESNSIISKCIKDFEWIITFFYGEHISTCSVSLEKLKSSIPDLASVSDGKILFLDFLPSNEEFRAYLYSKWKENCPSHISHEIILAMQRCFEIGVNEEHRKALEKLFYQSIFHKEGPFHEEEFAPCLLLINTKYKYLIKRNFMRKDIDSNLLNVLLEGITIIDSNNNNSLFSNPVRVAEFFKPIGFSNGSSLNYSSLIYNLDIAIAKFLDQAEDLISSIEEIKSDESNIIEKIQTTRKFENSFNILDKDLKRSAQKAITNLLNGNFSGIELEKIKLSNQMTFYRMRINNKYRIHFQGSPDKPIFINIGAHKLYEFGYVID